MGPRRGRPFPRLWLCATAACFLFLFLSPSQVFAESDADLVFENNLEESKLSHDNKHVIERRDIRQLNTLHIEPSQEEENNDHWLSNTVTRLKRRFLKSLFASEEDTTTESPNNSDDSHHGIASFGGPDSEFHKFGFGGNSVDDEDDFGEISGEGSGRPSQPIPGHPFYYRITMTLFEPFVEAYSDHNSIQFKKLAWELAQAIENLYKNLEGRQSATVIKVEKREANSFTSKATVDLGTVNFYDHGKIRNHLYSHIRNYHKLGRYEVSDEDFTFREFEGGTRPLPDCLSHDELACYSGECVPASSRCNGIRDCADGSDEQGCACAEGEHSCDLSRCIPLSKVCDRTEDCEDGTDEMECEPQRCPFRCLDGQCIETYQVCDRRADCRGAEDEENCSGAPSCRNDEFTCNDGRCIQLTQKCDRRVDCLGGEDEQNCGVPIQCRPDQFRCDDGSCIEGYQRCNRIVECSTGEDERECVIECREDQFRCNDGKCIEGYQKCDRNVDCNTGEDERDCPIVCRPDQFRCNDGNCIEGYQKCDRNVDCSNGEDERDCAIVCRPDQFSCVDGNCIEGYQKCDRITDCLNGEDERDCPIAQCNIEQFRCGDGKCIEYYQRCDGHADCGAGEDEEGCAYPTEPVLCRPDQFRCDDGNCIEQYQVCDNRVDCSNSEDESRCATEPPQCAANEFRCYDGRCISNRQRCDRSPDCTGGEDEANCPTVKCSPDQFDCEDGNCIPLYEKCDGRPQCPNYHDEINCGSRPCPGGEHSCNDGTCLPSYLVCDGTRNCADGSDENECGCQPTEFQCANGACIPDYLRCNRYPDCRDNSDEDNCPTPQPPVEPEPPTPPTSPNCPWGQNPCRSGNQCIPYTAICDGRYDCNDFSDESDCGGGGITPEPGSLNLKTYPNQQTIKESVYKPGREVVFQCRDEGPSRAKVQWLRANGQPLPQGSRDNNGRLEIPNIQIQHAGSYVCAAIGYPPSTPGSQVQVYLTVEAYKPPPTQQIPACELHQATCSNGQCIAKHLVCDGNYDCSDGSDETRCSPHGCEPNEYRCANKKCVLKTWRCDGEDDCGDLSDESNCATSPPGAPCRYSEFSCHSGNQCVPKSFHCDHQRDCADGSDEVGCSSVVISIPPPPMKILLVGDTFTITCTAVGVPTPEIVWRLNWGHIPDKCTTTSVNGVGTLTCPNIQREDQGAYSCEALNSLGTKLATPDTILKLNESRPDQVCPAGTFNDEANHQDECIACFCFGAATSCRSADLYTYQLQPPFDSHKYVGVHVDQYTGAIDVRDEAIYRGSQPQISPVGQHGVHAQLSAPYADLAQSDIVPYFVLPENFHGNQLKSYGGYLKYRLHYEGYGPPLNAPEIILIGNNYTLLHVGVPHQSGREEQISVRFFVGDWIKRSRNAPEVRASREEIMMALANVQDILIKLQYVNGNLDTTLNTIEMDSAAIRNTGQGKSVYVEECKCPVGYSGLSCENCAPGYHRHQDGPWLGKCYREPAVCPPGTYGDPQRGIPCNACPCPLTTPSNQFASTCSLAPDGGVICDCFPGYTGRRCERCAEGWVGNPNIPGDSCRQGSSCNLEGALSPVPDPYGRCICKQNTQGDKCDQCKPNTFHLSRDNKYGCISCFCMGITHECYSSNYYRDTINTAFTSSRNDFKLVESLRKEESIEQGIRLDQHAREIVYNEFSNRNQDVYYWSLPSLYLGDKLTAYGGNLRYSLRYVPMPGGQSSRNTAPDVEIISENQINLLYFGRDFPQPNANQNFTVPILEDHWQRSDGQKADREHLLMALADLKAVLIKATYTTNTRESALISVSLDIANEQNTGRERALVVEQCQCPIGYRGLSCEDCDTGYTRSLDGLYLGRCEPCFCNGHSSECDSESGDCLNCRDYTTGPNCEECLPGYTGDPANGGYCVPGGTQPPSYCHPNGALSPFPSAGGCVCKKNVEGPACDHCRPGTFGLNSSIACQECFCSGITNECSESNLYIQQIPSQILDQHNHGFSLSDQYRQNHINNDFVLNVAENKIGYHFKPGSTERWYWSLPEGFTGNKIRSYGGRLEFYLSYTAGPYGDSYITDQDIIIIGNGITIYWTNPSGLLPNIPNRISVQLVPTANWDRIENRRKIGPASREDILLALAKIEAILVRATVSSQTASSHISDITLDTAVEQYTTYPKAKDVEVCRCPPGGYQGTSCESCSTGYYRDINDRYAGPLGSCSRCPCNDHEERCVLGSDNRVICYCRPGWTGSACQDRVRPTEPPPTVPPPTQPPSTIIVEIEGPEIERISEGSSKQLICTARSSAQNLPIRLYWSKDGGQLPPDAIDDGRGVLLITDIRLSDSGRYNCHATDGYIFATAYKVINVGGGGTPLLPSVTIIPSTISINAGQSIELKCETQGSPAPTLQWIRKDGNPINPQHSFVNGVFYIPNAQTSDGATYQCIATNSVGSQISEAYVYVLPQSIISVKVSPPGISASAGDSFTLTCEAPVSQPQIAWSRPRGQRLPYNSHLSADSSILTVYDSRPDDSGFYVCTVTDFRGTSGTGNASVSITEGQPGTPPTVIIQPEKVNVALGSSAEIRCIVSGSPAPTIKWTKVGEALPSHIQQIGSNLRLYNAQMHDNGVYACVATNPYGFAQKSAVVEVNAFEPPLIKIHPSEALTVTAGGSLLMRCNVTAGHPQPELHWSRLDGRPLSPSIEHMSSGILWFPHITLEEAGEYACTATNAAGKATAIGHIEIHTIPQLSISPRSGNITVNEGQHIILECRASGVPQPTVQWSRESRRIFGDIPAPGGREIGYSTKVLQNVAVFEITRVTAADQGDYICEGRNLAGSAIERVTLSVGLKPERGDITGEDGSANPVTHPPYIPRPPYRDNEHIPPYPEKTFTAPVGTRAELRCQTESPSISDPLYVKWVRADNSTLPENSLQNAGILYIENVQPSDAGEYRCIGIHPSGTVLFNFGARLVVVSPPRIVLEPSRQVVRPGDNAFIECVASGEEPISVSWTAINRELPATAHAQDGHLRFYRIQVSDAGRYRCTAINSAGEADAVADVIVQDGNGPTITAESRELTAVPGTVLTLHCIVRGGEYPSPSVRWFREHLPMPSNARIQGEYVQIVDIQPADAGKYFCEVATEGGTAMDHIIVKVEQHNQFDGASELDIQATPPVAQPGDTVTIYCRSNEPGVITSWTKLSGRFENNVQTSSGTLQIHFARRENAGVYRCEARGYHGVYYKDFSLEIIDTNTDSIQGEQPIETKTAPLGSTVLMDCRTDLEQPITYQWSKPNAALPKDVDIYSRTIQLNDVRGTDAGTYVCTASNSRTSIDIPTILIVTGIVPYFAQAPISFVAMNTLPDAYIQFSFEISFKPEVPDGLILYNGHRKSSAKADFISLALVGGIPEFRFNLGYGVTTVRADKSISMGKWHTVKISRNRKKATMFVDGEGPFMGSADGTYIGLDLTEPMYLGGVPNFKDIAPEVQVYTGFVGCISRFKIGPAHVDILREATIKEGITTCETCSENPCHNQGVCQEALTTEGFTCICPLGYSGPTCSKHGGEACTPYTCGTGRCIDTEDDFKCLCPLGATGRRCERQVEIYEPGFSNGAYIAYPAPKLQRRLKVSLKFKPHDLNDGILLYSSENEEGYGDFASLAIRDRHIEFRFNIGNEPVVIKSDREIVPGEWLGVTASKVLNQGRLLVNGDAPILQRVPGNHRALNLNTPLYVGGIDKQHIHINQAVGIENGFNGCISELSVSGLDVNILKSAVDSANVEDCSSLGSRDNNENSNEISPHYTSHPHDVAHTGCSTNPCRNDGQCYQLSPDDYMCNCVHGYSGRNCEIAPNLCDHLHPCQNGGTCNGTSTSYFCDCLIGFAGNNCEQRADVRNEVNFNGRGYIELSNSLLSHKNDDETEVIAFELSTNTSDGLIFWHGQNPNEDGQGQDYISLAVVGGYLEYSFELGSGPAIIYNNLVRINDGERHRVILKRRGKWGSIEVDNDNIKDGDANGITNQMNCHGNIYLGGTPNNSLMTGSRYLRGFNGCIHGFEIQDSKMIDLGAKAIHGVNVKHCSSLNDLDSVFGRPSDVYIY